MHMCVCGRERESGKEYVHVCVGRGRERERERRTGKEYVHMCVGERERERESGKEYV